MQAIQAAPPAPQLPFIVGPTPDLHVPVASQQPLGQVVALQAVAAEHWPLLHVCGALQAWQVAPERPQAVAEVPGLQAPLGSQQPAQFADVQAGLPEAQPLSLIHI